jgi:Antp family protein
MASYFTNSYMSSDMHGHYPTGGDMDAQMHHYTQTHHNQSGMPPFPRYPPYDRMGYYNQAMEPGYSRPDSPSSQVGNVMGPQQAQQQPPPVQNGTMQPLQQQPPPQQQQQQPIVYTSCKLQAAVGNNGLGMIGADTGSPPLEQMGGGGHHNHMNNQQMQMGHHMHGQVNEVSAGNMIIMRMSLLTLYCPLAGNRSVTRTPTTWACTRIQERHRSSRRRT